MKKLNNRGSVGTTILIVLLIIALAGTVGYIAYDKLLSNNETVEKEPEQNIPTEEKQTITMEEVINTLQVGNVERTMHIPQIKATKETDNIRKFNEDMKKSVIELMSQMNATTVGTYDENGNLINIDATDTYKYLINGDIVAIQVTVQYSAWAASGPGDAYFNPGYFYDVKNDQILTLGQAAKLMNVDLGGAPSYERLDNLTGCEKAYMDINGSTAKIIYENAQECA